MSLNKKNLVVNSSYTAKANTNKTLAEVIDGVTSQALNVDEAINATIIGAKDSVFDNSDLTGGIIIGDVGKALGSTITGGADKFTIDNIYGLGGSILPAIVGDVDSAHGSVIRGGNDSIVINSDVLNGDIYGDVRSLNNSSLVAGNDSIVINGSVNNGDIYGDVGESNSSTITGGNDVITVKGSLSSASNIYAGVGNDKITVGSVYAGSVVDGEDGNDSIIITTMNAGVVVLAGTGNDKITFGSASNEDSGLKGGEVYGDEGNDSITITTMSGGYVHGNTGNDKITVTTMNAGAVYGDEGNDTITITTMSGEDAIGGDGNDSITITTMSGGTVRGNDGNDSITINTMSGGTVRAGDGNDKITIGTARDKDSGLKDGTVDGDAGNDTITITTMSGDVMHGATVNGGDGDDSITITTMSGGAVNGGEGDDIIKVTTTSLNGDIFGDAGDDNITVGTINDACDIFGGDGDDNITISNMNGSASSVDGGLGKDNITITTMNNGDINGSDGEDSISVKNMYAGSIDGNNDDDVIKVTTMHAGDIDGGSEDDSITIGEVKSVLIDPDDESAGYTNPTITGGLGNDTITITTMNGGTVTANDDFISINKYTAGTIISQGGNHLKVNSLGVRGEEATAAETALVDATGGGDILEVGWAFNGTFDNNGDNLDPDDDISRTLITKGLGGDAKLEFGTGNDGLVINGSLAAGDGTLYMRLGDDTLTVTGTLNREVDLGEGNDSVSVGTLNELVHMGDDDDYLKVTKKAADITEKDLVDALGEGNDTLEVGWAFNGVFNTLDADPQTGALLHEGGTLISKGLGSKAELTFGGGNDGLTINGSLTAGTEINMLGGNDDVTVTGTLSRAVDLGTGADTFSAGAMGKGGWVIYDNAGLDDITIKGTFNTGMVKDDGNDDIALSTGSDGGAITIDTWGTGELAFGNGKDTLTINKAFTGSYGSKDIDTGSGNDIINLFGTVNGATVYAGDGNDSIYATSLGASGAIVAGNGTDTIQLGRAYDESFSGKQVGSTLSAGHINAGNFDDTILIANTYTDADGNTTEVLGTMKGGFIDAGNGKDIIKVGTLSGGTIYGGGSQYLSSDSITITTMTGGIVAGGADGSDSTGNIINVTTMSGGTIISTSAYADDIDIVNMSGGSILSDSSTTALNVNITGTFSGRANISGNNLSDTINLNNMTGGTINGGTGSDGILLQGEMRGGTINGGAGDDEIGIHNELNDDASMYSGTINAGDGEDYILVDRMYGGTINGEAGDDYITLNDDFRGGTVNAGDGNDTIEVSYMHGGIINTGAGDDRIEAYGNMNGGTINANDGNDNIIINDEMNGGTINAGDGDNAITLRGDALAGRIIGGAGDDTLYINNVSVLSKLSIDLGAGNNQIVVNGVDESGEPAVAVIRNVDITLSAQADNITLENLVADSKINAGAGDDSIGAYTNDAGDTTLPNAENSFIDGNTGNDTIELFKVSDNSVIMGGVGNDSISVYDLNNSLVDGDTGNNVIEINTIMHDGKITTGSGHDKITVGGTVDGASIISSGTGNDLIDLSNATNESGTAINSSNIQINYDNKGQDTIKLANYTEGMVINNFGESEDADGNYFALSTGTDGGTIEIGTWTSGEITLGNGHDSLSIGTNNSAKTDTEITDLLGKGNDTLHVGWDFDGVFNAGDDGGTLIATGLGAGEDVSVTFGKGNDGLILSGNLSKSVDLKTGNDTVSVAGVNAGSLFTYDNVGFDRIFINGIYDGNGVRGTYKGEDQGLSTGADGGYIHVGSLTEAGVDALSFSDKDDHFSIDSLKVLDDAGDPSTANKEINLQKGSDSITIESLTDGTATIKYNTDGQDSIVIEGEYAGVGFNGYTLDRAGDEVPSGKLSTGSDGGSISIGSITDGAGVTGLEFSDKNDTFEIGTLDVTGVISLLSGNDTVTVKTTVTEGGINAGLGNDVFNIEDASGGVIYGDVVSLSSSSNFTGGADKFNIESLGGTAKIYGDGFHVLATKTGLSVKGGNDIITVEGDILGADKPGGLPSEDYGVVIVGDVRAIARSDSDFNIKITSGNDNIALKGNVQNATVYADFKDADADASGGNDTLTLGVKGEEGLTSVSNADINLGVGKDVFTAYSTLKDGANIYGGDGDDKFTIINMDGGEVEGGNFADSFIITNMNGGRVDGGNAKDSIKITNFNGGSVSGGESSGQDFIDTISITNMYTGARIDSHSSTINKINVTNMYGGNITGANANDTISISTATGGTIRGGAAYINKNGFDSITIENAVNTRIYGDDAGGTFDPTLSYNDLIKITGTSENSNVYGGFGNDTMTFTNFTGGFIEGGTANKDANGKLGFDSITIKNAINTIVYGDDAGGSFDATRSYNDIIKITGTNKGNTINGNFGDDTITMTTMNGGAVYGNDGNDSIVITTATADNAFISDEKATINGGNGDDYIKVTTLTNKSDLRGGAGSNEIIVITATGDSTITSHGSDDITVTTLSGAHITSYASNKISVGTMTNAVINGRVTESSIAGSGYNNEVVINKLLAGDIDLGAGDDHLKVVSKHASITDTDLVDTLGAGNDTLEVGWAFDGTLSTRDASDPTGASDEGDTLITKGLGANAVLDFGAGDDGLVINGAASGVKIDIPDGVSRDTHLADLVNQGGGNDTLQVGWTFDGKLTAGDDGGTLITQGLGANAELTFGDGDDGLVINGARSGVKNGMTDTELADSLGTAGNDTLQVGWAFDGKLDAGDDGGTLIATGLTKDAILTFGDGDDMLDIGNVLSHATDSTDDYIEMGAGNDDVILRGNSARAIDLGNNDDTFTATSNLLNGGSGMGLYIRGGAGDDTFEFKSISNVRVIGDYGDNSITVTGTMSNSGIYGGTGNDDINVNSMTTNAEILTLNASNVVTVDSMSSNAVIDSSDTLGDKVTVGSMSGSASIQGGNGVDTISITGTMSGNAAINGGEGNDDISIANMSKTANVYGDDGNDSISITGNVTSANIYGDNADASAYVGHDTISIDGTLNGGNIYAGAGNDSITIQGSFTNAHINGGGGNDDITLNGVVNGGSINGGDGNDTITLDNMITKGITIINDSGGVFALDTVYFANGLSNGANVNLNAMNGAKFIVAADRIGEDYHGFDMFGGILNASDSSDQIYINGMFAGTVNGDDGADTINMGAMFGGTVDGGAGADTITIASKIVDKVTFKNSGTEQDGLELQGGIGAGAVVTLSGNGGFIVRGDLDTPTAFEMTGGTLNGSVGTDSIFVNGMGSESEIDGKTVTEQAVINTGNGDDFINVGGTIVAGKINTGTGNDELYIGDTTNAKENLQVFLDTKGQDTIFIDNYDGGIFVDAKGKAVDLSTGTDGGEIHLETWTSGQIVFGNGNDTFLLAGDLDGKGVVNLLGGDDDLRMLNGLFKSDHIDGGAGNDYIGVNINDDIDNADIRSLTGGDGADTFSITSTGSENTGIYITDFDIYDTLFLDNVDHTAAARDAQAQGNDRYTYTDAITGRAVTVYFDDAAPSAPASDDTVTSVIKSAITFENATDAQKSIYLNGGVGAGGEVWLTSTHDTSPAGFNVSNTSGSGFNMSGGFIYATQYNDHITLNNMSGGVISTNASDDTVTVKGTLSGSAIIRGDADDDTITITTMSGGSVEGGTGVDNITVSKNMSGGSIDGGTGVDSITVSGSMSGSAKINGGEDNDDITVSGTMSGNAAVYGDGDNDDITVTGTMSGNAKINGGEGNDTITITTMSKTANVYGDGGNDSISITGNVTSANIYGDNADASAYVGHDTISIGGNLNGGNIYAGDGNDSITIQGSFTNANIDGDGDNDSITIVGAVSGGSIGGGDGNDDITLIAKVTKTITISNDRGSDTVYFENGLAAGANVNLHSMNGGDFTVAKSYDTINDDFIGFDMTGGILNGSHDRDILYLENMKGGTINADDGFDFVDITEMTAGAVNGGNAEDTMRITTMNGGTVNGGNDNDTIEITTMNAGTVNGQNGNDAITINVMSGGTVDGGAGKDTINITNQIANKVTIKNTGTERDDLDLQGGIGANAVVTLSSNAGFNVLKSGANGFDMTGGTLNASAGNDDIRVASITGGIINAGTGNDLVVISNGFSGSTINAGAGNDIIAVYGSIGAGAKIITGTGNDSIGAQAGVQNVQIVLDNKGQDTIELAEYREGMFVDAKGNTVALSTGSDGGDIYLQAWVSGGITFGNGVDRFISQNVDMRDRGFDLLGGNDFVQVGSVGTVGGSGGTIKGGSGNDDISVGIMRVGTIDGGTGNDSITIFNMNGGTIDGGTGNDNITVTTFNNGTINGGDGNDSIIVTSSITDGTVNGGDGNDSIGVYSSITGGTINGGTGNDVFTIASMGEGIINGDAGNDVFNITSITDGIINGGAGNDTFNVTIDNTLGVISLQGNDGADLFNLKSGDEAGRVAITDLTDADTVHIDGKDYTTQILEAQETSGSVTFDGITIYFSGA